MGPIASVGKKSQIGQGFLRAASLALELGELVGELDQQLAVALSGSKHNIWGMPERSRGFVNVGEEERVAKEVFITYYKYVNKGKDNEKRESTYKEMHLLLLIGKLNKDKIASRRDWTKKSDSMQRNRELYFLGHSVDQFACFPLVRRQYENTGHIIIF